MLRYKSIILILCFLASGKLALCQDYFQYHKQIIDAEEQAFIKQDVKTALKIYRQTFDQYQFVFLQDCVTALQLALYANDGSSMLWIADKATKNGLMPRHLARIAYIRKHPLYISYKDSIISLYRRNRSQYLKRLDTAALKVVYDLFARDQMEKNYMKGEREEQQARRYKPQIKRTMEAFVKLVSDKGFPSDKLVGIDQNDIMQELKTGRPDAIEYYHENKNDYHIQESQFVFEEYQFASTLYFPIVHHYVTTYVAYEKLFSDSFYLHQIRTGNMHPKDVAAIKGIRISIASNGSNHALNNGEMYFAIGFRPEGAVLLLPDKEINRYRKQFYIAPIEIDRAKMQFMRKNKMYLGWGHIGLRS